MIFKNCIFVKFYPNVTELDGFYLDDEYVYINDKLGKLDKELVYIHESKHRDCFLNNCFCNSNIYLCEYHAFKAELDFVLKNPYIQKVYLKAVNEDYKKFKQFPNTYAVHLKVLKNLMKTKNFKKILFLCEQK